MNYFVQLRRDSPFFAIFENGSAPVKPVAVPNVWTTRGTAALTFVTCALCGGAKEAEPCVWLDWNRCTAGQRDCLALTVCELRGGDPREFLSFMDRGGALPIRVSQTDKAPFRL
jgi:hypothetical protein